MTVVGRALAKARREVAIRAGSRTGRGVILLYHRIGRPGDDPWNLVVSPERFGQHMELLRSEFQPLPLVELVEAARRRRIPRGAVAVTFDDGYVDNLTDALPVLERNGVPATVFIATGFVGAERPFWWDELRELYLGNYGLPEEEGLTSRVERETAYEELRDTLKDQPPREVQRRLARLREDAGLAGPPSTGDARPMTREELERLAASELIDIGCHSRGHPSLSALSPALVREEIEGSKADLAGWLGATPAMFSYPFGMQGPRLRRAARRAGFAGAVGTHPMAVSWLSDRRELGRLWVEDESPEWLEVRLRGVAA